MYYGGAALQPEMVEGLLHTGRRKVDFQTMDNEADGRVSAGDLTT
jgi:hypothetical protein